MIDDIDNFDEIHKEKQLNYEMVRMWMQDHVLLTMRELYSLVENPRPLPIEKISYPTRTVSYWEAYMYSLAHVTFASHVASQTIAGNIEADPDVVEILEKNTDPGLVIISYALDVAEQSEDAKQYVPALRLLKAAAFFDLKYISQGELTEHFTEAMDEVVGSVSEEKLGRALSALDQMPHALRYAVDLTFHDSDPGLIASEELLIWVTSTTGQPDIEEAPEVKDGESEEPSIAEVHAGVLPMKDLEEARKDSAADLHRFVEEDNQLGLIIYICSPGMARGQL